TAIASGTNTVQRSVRSTRRSRGALGRPGRGGFKNARTLLRTKSAVAAKAKAISAHLNTMPGEISPSAGHRIARASRAHASANLEVDLLQGLDAVAQLGGALEVEPLRGVLHGALELRDVRGQGSRTLPLRLRRLRDLNRIVIPLGHRLEQLPDRLLDGLGRDAVPGVVVLLHEPAPLGLGDRLL